MEYPNNLSQIPHIPSERSYLLKSLTWVVWILKGATDPVGYLGGKENIVFPFTVYDLRVRSADIPRGCGWGNDTGSLNSLSSFSCGS